MSFLKMLYYGLLGICLFTLLFNIKKLNRIYYWFIPLIIFAITVQVSEEILRLNNIKGNSFVFHIYQPVEYSLLALFYYSLIKHKVVKMMILLSVPAMLFFSIYYYTWGPGLFYGPDFIDFCIEAFFVCIWVVVFFFELLKSEENLKLATYPAFWINAANLLFYGGCLLVMGVYYYLVSRNKTLANQLLYINYYLNLVLYCMYTIAFIQPLKWKR